MNCYRVTRTESDLSFDIVAPDRFTAAIVITDCNPSWDAGRFGELRITRIDELDI